MMYTLSTPRSLASDLHLQDVDAYEWEAKEVLPAISINQPASEDGIDSQRDLLPEVGSRDISSPSHGNQNAKTNTKNLPNLMAKSLVARFKKVQVTKPKNQRTEISYDPDGSPDGWALLPKVGGNIPGGAVNSWRVQTAEAALYLSGDGNPKLHDRKAVSAPAVMDKADTDDANTAKSPENKLTPFQEALENVEKMRRRIREDKLAGISTNYSMPNSQSNSAYSKRKRKEFRVKKNVRIHDPMKKSVNDKSTDKSETGGKEDSEKKENDNKFKPPPIKAHFEFPKGKDFIVTEEKNIKELHIEWMVKSMFKKNTVESTTYRPETDKKSTIPGHISKNLNPVTEALHKHGTSLTKRTAKALNRPGDWGVCKVWKRQSENFPRNLNPHLMAKEDISIDDAEEPWEPPFEPEPEHKYKFHYSPKWRRNGGRRMQYKVKGYLQ